jgi:hypothetical protein
MRSCGLTRKRKHLDRAISLEDVANGDAFAVCTNLLSVRYSFDNSNSSIDSIDSPEQ